MHPEKEKVRIRIEGKGGDNGDIPDCQAFVKKGMVRSIDRTFDMKAKAEAWAKVTESEMARGVFVPRKELKNNDSFRSSGAIRKKVMIHKKGFQEKAILKNMVAHLLAKGSLAAIQGEDIAADRDARLKGSLRTPFG